MSIQRENLSSTTDAGAALAQSRSETGGSEILDTDEAALFPGEGTWYTLGEGIDHAATTQPYERQDGDPLYRPLHIYSLDPSLSSLSGQVALVQVPYERLQPGPVGALFEVDNFDGQIEMTYRRVDLDDPANLIANGRPPSPTDPLFHQQMVYAVCSLTYASFQRALGRHLTWGFDHRPGETRRLKLRPHAFEGANAYYDKNAGTIDFGYYRAHSKVIERNLPQGYVFTCLSHDIIVHELSHALLDGLRAHFTRPCGPDVLAFHEAFADLIAVFQHFSYDKVVAAALGKARGRLEKAELLVEVARQFGHTTGAGGPLRNAIDTLKDDSKPPMYGATDDDPHTLSRILVAAVFDAFMTIYRRKIAAYVRLATAGTGILPDGDLPGELQTILAKTASRKLAGQFLSICIRAVDYCPTIDLEFGEYLRAVITADRDLVPDDPWGYREAWIDAFRRRGIFPRGVDHLSEDALLWQPPQHAIPPLNDLSFSQLRFEGEPGQPAGVEELHRQARALGWLVSQPAWIEEFGCTMADDPRLRGDLVDPPRIQSIRTSQRVGPDGQIVFDLIAEVSQRRLLRRDGKAFDFYGGATVILDPRGSLRYIVRKSVLSEERMERQRKFIASDTGRTLWKLSGDVLQPNPDLLRNLHIHASNEGH